MSYLGLARLVLDVAHRPVGAARLKVSAAGGARVRAAAPVIAAFTGAAARGRLRAEGVGRALVLRGLDGREVVAGDQHLNERQVRVDDGGGGLSRGCSLGAPLIGFKQDSKLGIM